MKRLLIGLTLLVSFSSFSNEIKPGAYQIQEDADHDSLCTHWNSEKKTKITVGSADEEKFGLSEYARVFSGIPTMKFGTKKLNRKWYGNHTKIKTQHTLYKDGDSIKYEFEEYTKYTPIGQLKCHLDLKHGCNFRYQDGTKKRYWTTVTPISEDMIEVSNGHLYDGEEVTRKNQISSCIYKRVDSSH